MTKLSSIMRSAATAAALVVVLASLLSAGQPRISGVVADGVGHSSVRLYWTSSISAYAQVKYGTMSGVYPYRSYSDGPTAAPSIAVTGLAPGTTYYLRVTSRPNESNDADSCADASCGSVEQVIMTLPEPPQHPEFPAQPATFSTDEPDTTGYTVRRLTNAADGSCVSASDGSTLQQMLNSASYGTVIEFPQGITCKIFASKMTSPAYILPAKAIDPQAKGDMNSPEHRWIILRTAGPASDFPPPGTRTGPQWAGKLAKLEAQERTGTQIFTNDSRGYAHHYRIENLELTHAVSAALFPPDAMDPEPMGWLVQFWARYSNTPATWIILDRLYIHGRGAPARIKGAVGFEGVHMALINSWVDKIDYWRIYQPPADPPAVSTDGKTINIPQGLLRRNAKEPPVTLSSPASATLSADSSYSGNFVAYLGPSGVTIEYGLGNVAIACSNCAAKQTTNPAAPYNQFLWCSGTISQGKFNITRIQNAPWTTSWYVTEGSFAVMLNDGGGPYDVSNNHLEGYGINFFIDGSGIRDPAPSDMVFRHNHLFWNQDHRFTSATSDGYSYSVRNLWEIKRGRRFLLEGNLFEGNWTSVNNGTPIYVAESPLSDHTLQEGSSDITIINNVIRHHSTGFQCRGYSGGAQDPPTTQRVRFANNLLYDINQFTYDANGPSANGEIVEQYLACQDLAIENNTFASNLGHGPAQMTIIGGQGEGLSFINNILYLNFANWGGIVLDGHFPSTTHPMIPAPEAGTYKHKLDTSFVRVREKVQPDYAFANNVIIGGTTGGAASDRRDLTATEMAGYAAQYPPANLFPMGNTQAEREAQVGFANSAGNDFRLSQSSPYRAAAIDGGSVGVNHDVLIGAQGLVGNIKAVSVTANGALLSYTAPDGRACIVDTSADGASWNRISDGGGPRARTVAVSGLTPNTSYQFRVLCYFEQRNDQPLFEPYADDEVTSGTFQTLASSAGGLKTFHLRTSGPGAVQVIVEYGHTTAFDHATAAKPCAPDCSVAIPSGGGVVYYRWKYLDAGGATVAQSAIGMFGDR